MIHTHVHTKYSLRDSIIDYDDMIQRLKDVGQNAVAITDHGNIYASVSIYKKLKKAGIKYVHGSEMYVCDDINIKDPQNKYYHLIVLCKNEEGRINLNKLISMSNEECNFYNKPRIDLEMLSKHKEGLLIQSACLAGEIPKYLLSNPEEAKARAIKYQQIFGDDYYLEIQARNDPEQIQVNQKIVELSELCDIPIVVTTDAHYTSPEDKKYHNVYSFNSTYKEDDESQDIYADCYIQSESEIRNNLSYLPTETVDTAIANTHIIADKCNVELPLSAPIIPHVDIPHPYASEKEYVIHICKQGFENRGINAYSSELQQLYQSRYEYELNAVEEMGFLGYYILVYTYANKVKRRGIARGSGGGSLLCYLMHITDIDPIEHKLYFERFIDVGALEALRNGDITRKELKVPDIDLDFGVLDRHIIIESLIETYGQQHAACIGRFNYNQSRGTLTDIGRALNIPLEQVKTITKALGDYELDDVYDFIAMYDKNPKEASNVELVLEFKDYIRKYPDLFEYSMKLIGLPSSFGLHSCGRAIVMKDLDYYTASCYHKSGERYLQGDMHDIEDLGIVKIDLLGLRNVDVIYDTLELIGKDYEYINPKKLDFSDENVLKIFQTGDTVGIFQFESYGMRATLSDMQPTGIDDLSVANALYRPGAMAYIKNYCNRKKGIEEVSYLHDDLIDILSNTYGIMVFQEQLIEIGRLAKLKNPDNLRRATGKKDKALMDKVRPELQQSLIARGWSEEQFDQLWDDMLKFAKYAFNKSHSSAYAIIAFIDAKLKAYHPLEFYCSLMNSYIDDSASYIKEKAQPIVDDILNHDFAIAEFNFRKDHRVCNISDGKISYAIPLIKNCSKQNAIDLYELRKNSYGGFTELLYDIAEKTTINQQQLGILIDLGFFREFGNARLLKGINETFVLFKSGAAKQMAVTKLEDNHVLENIVKRCSRLSDSGKTYMNLNVKRILDEIEEWLQCNDVSDYALKVQMEIQQENLGYVNLTTGKPEDRRKLLILSTKPLVSKNGNRTWAYAVETISIGSGKKSRLTIWSRTFESQPLQVNDVVYAYKVEKNKKGYWYLLSYKIINSETK